MFGKKLKEKNELLKLRINELEHLLCPQGHDYHYINWKPVADKDKPTKHFYICHRCKQLICVADETHVPKPDAHSNTYDNITGLLNKLDKADADVAKELYETYKQLYNIK